MTKVMTWLFLTSVLYQAFGLILTLRLDIRTDMKTAVS